MFDRFRKGENPASAAGAPAQPQSELHARRDELAGRVAELTWDLGGLTYEMAIRDHFRLDVLVRRAAELQEVDAQLGEVERLLASSYEGVGGSCRACGSPHSRGAVFCWHCGTQLVEQAPSAAAGGVAAPAPDFAAGNPGGQPFEPAPYAPQPPDQQTAVIPSPTAVDDNTILGAPAVSAPDDTISGGPAGASGKSA